MTKTGSRFLKVPGPRDRATGAAIAALTAIAAALAPTSPSSAAAPAADTVAQPAVHAGDTWSYRATLERTPNLWKQSHTESTVVRSSPTSVLLRNSEVGSTNPPAEFLVNPDWSRFRSIGGKETVVYRPLTFPLGVGKTWDLDYTDDHPSNAAHKSERRELHYRAVGWEEVEVPAGKFRALKIEADGSWSGEVAPKTAATMTTVAGANGSTAAAQTVNVTARTVSGRLYAAVWYVPEARRFVKTVEEFYDTAGVRNERNTVELESYKLAD